jgi:hypothetical protein
VTAVAGKPSPKREPYPQRELLAAVAWPLNFWGIRSCVPRRASQ